uniref:Uncharacterized protein n=1 Tax=Odontella aurita TaxID=265563 RepID=A0A7S4JHA6_9STRA|mmetsp:Transcript_46187/g.140013  ORF Transcript_46187/g.140013 Transcript_46187/m.140013 type:complete len:134 (+) Transcript_46187:2-403(+)
MGEGGVVGEHPRESYRAVGANIAVVQAEMGEGEVVGEDPRECSCSDGADVVADQAEMGEGGVVEKNPLECCSSDIVKAVALQGEGVDVSVYPKSRPDPTEIIFVKLDENKTDFGQSRIVGSDPSDDRTDDLFR